MEPLCSTLRTREEMSNLIWHDLQKIQSLVRK